MSVGCASHLLPLLGDRLLAVYDIDAVCGDIGVGCQFGLLPGRSTALP